MTLLHVLFRPVADKKAIWQRVHLCKLERPLISGLELDADDLGTAQEVSLGRSSCDAVVMVGRDDGRSSSGRSSGKARSMMGMTRK